MRENMTRKHRKQTINIHHHSWDNAPRRRPLPSLLKPRRRLPPPRRPELSPARESDLPSPPRTRRLPSTALRSMMPPRLDPLPKHWLPSTPREARRRPPLPRNKSLFLKTYLLLFVFIYLFVCCYDWLLLVHDHYARYSVVTFKLNFIQRKMGCGLTKRKLLEEKVIDIWWSTTPPFSLFVYCHCSLHLCTVSLCLMHLRYLWLLKEEILMQVFNFI